MPSEQHKILNVGRDESLLKPRSAILESAGYEVVPVVNILDVERSCEKPGSFDLMILGYALPKFEKRRVLMMVRQFCGHIPVLELYPHGSAPADMEADEQLPSTDEPDALLTKVNELLINKRKKRRVASRNSDL